MRLPDRWEIEFEDYKGTVIKNNNNLYDGFTEQQYMVMQEYYMWRTVARFKRFVNDTGLKVKADKVEKLAEIAGYTNDWVYAGCVDKGRMGGGHCELGHALRYEHYAYSKSVNKRIKFGVKCASDFFDVSEKVLGYMQKSQSYASDDIKLIKFIMDTGKYGEFVRMFYPDLGEIVKFYNERVGEIFGTEWNYHMGQFLKAGLPFTSSMIMVIDSVREKRYSKDKKKVEDRNTLYSIVGDNAKYFENNLHYSKICQTYLNQFGNNDVANKNCNAVLNQAVRFSKAYDYVMSYGIKDVEKFSNSGSMNVVYVRTSKGERVATLKEKELMPVEAFIKEHKAIADEKIKYLLAFGWCATGNKYTYEKLKLSSGKNDEELVKLHDSFELVGKALDWISSEEFKEDLKTLIAFNKQKVYLDTAEDEVTETVSMDEMCQQILDGAANLKSPHSLIEIALDIIQRKNTYSDFQLSDKQRAVLCNAYKLINGGGTDSWRKEVIDKAMYVLKNRDIPEVRKTYGFGIKVCNTVIEKGYFSSKQKDIILEAYNGVKSITDNQPAIKQIFIDEDEYSPYNTDAASEDSRFIEESDDTKVLGGGFDEFNSMDDSNTFVEVRSNPYRNNTSMEHVDDAINLPSIVDISNALGVGKFHVEPIIEEE